MELTEEVSTYLNKKQKDYLIYSILNHYDSLNQNSSCFSLLTMLTDKLKHNINLYQKEPKKELYNLIDNDFITLKDLYLESKEVYNLAFNVSSLVFLANLNYEELNIYYQKLILISKYDAKTELDKILLNYIQLDTNDNYDLIINQLKKKLTKEEFRIVLIYKINYDLRKGYHLCGKN